jgi:rare lipoprotein A
MNATQYSTGAGTASGQPFRPDGLTAAHRSLPFGTRVRVSNPRTGATVVVIINDRGPFTRGRDIDLSRGAARAIGLTDVGRICADIL